MKLRLITTTMLLFVLSISSTYSVQAAEKKSENNLHLKEILIESKRENQEDEMNQFTYNMGFRKVTPLSLHQGTLRLKQEEITLQNQYLENKKQKGATQDNSIIQNLNRAFEFKLAGYGAFFYDVCNQYQVNPYLAASIMIYESYRGASPMITRQNNVGGMRVHGTWMTFSSLEEGITAFVANLSNLYTSQGLTSPEAMAGRYAEGSQEWVKSVNIFYHEIASGSCSFAGAGLNENLADASWLN
ncbi:MAG: glucosaminidase domain-containing protein [Erysipelotrichaceae bacterium]